MFYLLIGLHVVMILIAAWIWERRGLAWSSMQTAWCVVMPFAVGLGFIVVSVFIPQRWSEFLKPWAEQHPELAFLLVSTIPLAVFWTWFFLSDGKGSGARVGETAAGEKL